MLLFTCSPAAEKLGEKIALDKGKVEDPLLDSLTILEKNCALARNCFVYARQAFNRFFKHFFLKDTALDSFRALAQKFNGEKDLMLAYHRAATKTGVETLVALAMASDQAVDWD